MSARFGVGIETRGTSVRLFVGLGYYGILEIGRYPSADKRKKSAMYSVEVLACGPFMTRMRQWVPFRIGAPNGMG